MRYSESATTDPGHGSALKSSETEINVNAVCNFSSFVPNFPLPTAPLKIGRVKV